MLRGDKPLNSCGSRNSHARKRHAKARPTAEVVENRDPHSRGEPVGPAGNRAIPRNDYKRRYAAGLKKPAMVDLLTKNLTLPVRNPDRFYNAPERAVIKDLERNPTSYSGFTKLGIYSSNELSQVRSKTMPHCVNKAAKIFGISPKDKHWMALIRCIVCTGLNRADFRSVMRIRDLKIRGQFRAYQCAVTSFIAHLPSIHVGRALPAHFARKRSETWETPFFQR